MVKIFDEKLWVKGHIISKLNVPASKVLFSEHHLSHAASAFFCSPFSEAAIVTVDGVGDRRPRRSDVAPLVGPSHVRRPRARRKAARERPTRSICSAKCEFPHSIGLLYSVFTAFLGFEVNEGEYKVMGWPRTGRRVRRGKVWKVVEQNGGRISSGSTWIISASTIPADRSFNRRFVDLFGEPRPTGSMRFFTESTGRQYFGEKPPDYNAVPGERALCRHCCEHSARD